VAVRIRMKKLGRLHRPFFRICAMDAKRPRDGRVLEELGTYDPMVPDTDARTVLNQERVAYWLGVGAQPSDKVEVLIKKYGPNGTHVQQAEQARARLALPKAVPPAPKPVELPKKPQPEEAVAEPAAQEPAAPEVGE
jgi:small subunit ribosomal protein S16